MCNQSKIRMRVTDQFNPSLCVKLHTNPVVALNGFIYCRVF